VLRPDNAHLYGRIVALGDDLFRPLLTRVISDGVADGVFDTFDPEGVGDMIQGLPPAPTRGSWLFSMLPTNPPGITRSTY
jgi:hypothetical protein